MVDREDLTEQNAIKSRYRDNVENRSEKVKTNASSPAQDQSFAAIKDYGLGSSTQTKPDTTDASSLESQRAVYNENSAAKKGQAVSSGDGVDHNEASDKARPEKPKPLHTVFGRRWKMFIIFMSALGSFISPISTNLYWPALPTLANYYNVSNSLINLTLTTYMIMQGIAPAFFGDFADQSGHRPAFIVSMVIYFGANVGCAVQSSYPALMVLRCLQSAGSSGTIALRNAVVANVVTPAERGTYLGLMQAGALLALTTGPVIGGALTQYLGWRSTFWFLVIICGAYIVPYVLLIPETNRKIVANGSVPPQNWWNKSGVDFIRPWPYGTAEQRREQECDRNFAPAAKLKMKLLNPLTTLVLTKEKDVALILFYAALLYTALYMVVSTIPAQFKRIYGFNDLEVGLCYLPIGMSMGVTAFAYGRLLDWNYRRVAIAHGFPTDKKRTQDLRRFPIEKARLQPMGPLLLLCIASILCYGWTLEQDSNLAGPLVLQFLLGGSLLGSFESLNNILVDMHPDSPATITAANNLWRCLIGAAGVAATNPMIEGIGVGWSYTLIAMILVVLSPLLLVELRMGPKWREARHVRMDRKKEEQKAR